MNGAPSDRRGLNRLRPSPERIARKRSMNTIFHNFLQNRDADAERYVHTVRDLTFPIGDVAVGIGSHS